MKKITKILFFTIILFTVIFTISCSDSLKDKYNRLDKNHVIKEITPNNLVKKIEAKDTFIVVLGFPTCPWCQQLMPVLDDMASLEGKNIKKNLYYCDLKDMRDNEDSPDKENYNFLYNFSTNGELNALDVEKDRINAPTIFVINNGELVGYHLNTVSSHVLDESNTLPELSDSQYNELEGIIKDLFKKIS